jgi:plasmid stabilization system protein ParE
LSPRQKRSRTAAVALTQRALADLREIEHYSIKEWGRKTAHRYLGDIASALDRIRENPKILRLEPDLTPGLFFYRVKKHFLVCDFHGETVIVLAVIHTSMDLPARLLDLEPRLIAEAQLLQSQLHKKPDEDSPAGHA